MDEVRIRGLEIFARHGVYDEEKIAPQKFIIDADIYTDFYGAAENDDLNKTVNYAKACDLIYNTVINNCFNLIETLAYECAENVIALSGVNGVKLTVWKPDAPVQREVKNVGVSVELKKVKALLSLGSSEGDKKVYLDKALKLLNATRGIEVKKVSSYIFTEPYGGVAQNTFLNCAAEIETYLPPLALLKEINRIEEECGRVRTVHWGDRTLDIDIIFYGKEIISGDALQIPHPEYLKRDFVLKPLKEIAPFFVCPLTGKRIKDL
ncbi:MAG: 2-amino-4-hydroxy-6-hydroxymethyldihydropteridine diphosphokinase [Clostridia bacterium]|nr:2-amino-4-hydroxy-6-hydroxymethyldihydropteridine diphosphokinase [Clostridia bacterium]